MLCSAHAVTCEDTVMASGFMHVSAIVHGLTIEDSVHVTVLIDGSDVIASPTGDNCTDIGYDPSVGSSDTFDKAGFGTYIRSHAEPAATHRCARYVRLALCNGGHITAACNGGPDANKYGPFLEKLGFSAVATGSGLSLPPGYTPQVGDVAVFAYDPWGHVCAWDGSNWVSDFVQSSIQPSPNSNPDRPYTIYRKP